MICDCSVLGGEVVVCLCRSLRVALYTAPVVISLFLVSFCVFLSE